MSWARSTAWQRRSKRSGCGSGDTELHQPSGCRSTTSCSPSNTRPWKPFTRELIDYAHLRGIRVGINVQLFGASNLQNAYDLVDKEMEPVGPQIAARLPLITKDLPLDVYPVSFGEFFNADPRRR